MFSERRSTTRLLGEVAAKETETLLLHEVQYVCLIASDSLKTAVTAQARRHHFQHAWSRVGGVRTSKGPSQIVSASVGRAVAVSSFVLTSQPSLYRKNFDGSAVRPITRT